MVSTIDDKPAVPRAMQILTEDIITTTQAALEFKPAVRPSTMTLWRWMKKGRKGVKLDHLDIGGRIFTSKQAIHRFLLETQGLTK